MDSTYGDYCPIAKQKLEITVHYVEVMSINMRGYKKCDFDCDNEDCQYLKTVRCPLFLSAPNKS